jgi:hypothetical protein
MMTTRWKMTRRTLILFALDRFVSQRRSHESCVKNVVLLRH